MLIFEIVFFILGGILQFVAAIVESIVIGVVYVLGFTAIVIEGIMKNYKFKAEHAVAAGFVGLILVAATLKGCEKIQEHRAERARQAELQNQTQATLDNQPMLHRLPHVALHFREIGRHHLGLRQAIEGRR